jgi:hypothetical protein
MLANRRTEWLTGRDRDDQRQNIDRDARRDEHAEEMRPVVLNPEEHHGEEDQAREGGRDDDLARHREGEGNEPQDIGDQNEKEDAEDEGEKAHAVLARRGPQHAGGEFVSHFAERLHAGRHGRAAPRGDGREEAGQGHDEQHEQPGIGQRDVITCNLDRDDRIDGELLGRMHFA